MNYGEDLAYWYLRLNGFFPITNFVVHRSKHVEHRSDIDVLGIRPPHVYEDVGGQSHDWDNYLTAHLPFTRTLGIICEVKTGAFEENKLFRADLMRYTIPRLGLAAAKNWDAIAGRLADAVAVEVREGAFVAKLLVNRKALT